MSKTLRPATLGPIENTLLESVNDLAKKRRVAISTGAMSPEQIDKFLANSMTAAIAAYDKFDEAQIVDMIKAEFFGAEIKIVPGVEV